MLTQLCKIHGLIEFNDLEEEIIRHSAFNRLADVKQLGYAYKGAYKGATHTRLSHALGTCFIARKIFDTTIEKNFKLLKKFSDNPLFPTKDELQRIKKDRNILSAATLLHDINHTPFAHCIESHLEYIPNIINSAENFEKNIEKFNSCHSFNKDLREKVKDVLITERHNNFEFANLFQNIIRGELGASTIDFIVRDHLESGFEKIGLFRLYESFIFIKRGNKIELGLDLMTSSNPLTMVYHLLFNRYKLSQIVYFHKTCASAEAMIGKALRKLIAIEKASNRGYDNFKALIAKHDTDEKFMYLFRNNDDKEISDIGKKLLKRQIFDDAFIVEWSSNKNVQNHLCASYRTEDKIEDCTLLEEAIAKEVNLPKESIAIYCYNHSMYGFDIDKLLIVDKSLQATEFDKFTSSAIERYAINEIKKLHQKLWKFYVFCDKDKYEKNAAVKENIKELCQRIFKSSRTLTSFVNNYKTEKFKTSAKDNIKTEIGKDPLISKKIFISYSQKNSKGMAEELYNKLNDWGYSPYNYRYKTNPGRNWDDDVIENLQSSNLFIILWSKEASKSEHVKDEINAAKRLDIPKFILTLDDTELPTLSRINSYDYFKNNQKDWDNLKKLIESAIANAI